MINLEGEKVLSPRRRWLPVFITLVILLGVGFFIWRIFHYLDLIKSGEIVQNRVEQARDMTVSQLMAAAAATDSETFEFSLVDEPAMGNPTAAFKIIMFADFGCLYSRQAAFTMRALASQFGDKIYFVYKDFPLVDLHPEAEAAAEAAACAKDQGKFWEYHDRLYQNQSDFSRGVLVEHARALDLETNKFISCLNSGVKAAEVEADTAEGLAAGVYGTPTFFFGQEKIDGVIPADLLRGIIEKMVE